MKNSNLTSDFSEFGAEMRGGAKKGCTPKDNILCGGGNPTSLAMLEKLQNIEL